MSKSRKGNLTMLSTSKNKWQDRKRNKTRGDADDEQSCSPVKQMRTIQQNEFNMSSDRRSDSEELSSNEEADNVKMKTEILSKDENSESDIDTDTESDISNTGESSKRPETNSFAGRSDDDDDDDDSGSEDDSEDGTEIDNSFKLKTSSSKVESNQSEEVTKSKQFGLAYEKDDSESSLSEDEEIYSGTDDDDDDDSDDEEGEQVIKTDKQIELRNNSKSESSPSSQTQLSGSRSEFPKTINKDIEKNKKEKDSYKTDLTEGNDSDDSDDDNDVSDFDKPDRLDGNVNSDDESDTDDDVDDDAGTTEPSEKDEIEDEFASVKKELANIPLEDLMKIKEKLGLKTFNRIMHGDKFEDKKQKEFKRANKNRPMEMSSKKWVPVVRQSVVPKEKVRRDPRFDDLSGEFQDKHFMKNYSFLDDVKSKEKLLVQKKMQTTKDEDKKKELEKLLGRMTQQEQIEIEKKRKSELEQQWKVKEKQLVKEGKTPYFLKKSDKKKLELAEKFKELQKSGKVDQYMSKKLKKNAQKEKKKLPDRHQRFM